MRRVVRLVGDGRYRIAEVQVQRLWVGRIGDVPERRPRRCEQRRVTRFVVVDEHVAFEERRVGPDDMDTFALVAVRVGGHERDLRRVRAVSHVDDVHARARSAACRALGRGRVQVREAVEEPTSAMPLARSVSSNLPISLTFLLPAGRWPPGPHVARRPAEARPPDSSRYSAGRPKQSHLPSPARTHRRPQAGKTLCCVTPSTPLCSALSRLRMRGRRYEPTPLSLSRIASHRSPR